MIATLKAFGLALMLFLQPHAPWAKDYPAIADAQAHAVTNHAPIFEGTYAPQKTVALLVALAWFESRFNLSAIGDHGRAHGIYQDQNHGALEKESAEYQTTVALDTIRQSFHACRDKTVEERLGWYAAGGNDCERGLVESRHRMQLAEKLFRRFAE